MLLLYYMEINEETCISNRLKIIDLHHEELSESFQDHLFAIVTKQNYDEYKLLKTDYITYLYAKKFNISRALLAFF